ncbi:MAG: signal recognition particle-docking protein FtsY [Clostridiales bacterium]|nr:signal recognition particle-docking protein FtsY [Clostridiales bacterium]
MGFFKWFKKDKKEEKIGENINLQEQEETQEIVNEKEEVQEIANEQEEIQEIVNEQEEEVQEIANEQEEIQEIANEQEEVQEIVNEQEEIQEIVNEQEEIQETVNEQEEIQETLNEQDEKKKEDISNTLEETKKEEEAGEESKKKGFFAKIKMGLSKTRDSILNGVEQVLSSFTKIDEELFEELEESLIMSDIGVETSTYIIGKVREIVKAERIKDVAEIKDVIVRVISNILEEDAGDFILKSPSVILIIGVNGVGKTTTIGKLASNYKKQGKKVILAAGDTFRAAAIDQLQVWGERNGIDVIKHQEGSDPAAVVFDAIQAGKARGADLLICDTAGRLHNKKNLMEELKKISRIVNRENPDAQIETLLALDATTGQNALQQAKLFSEVSDITGIVLTKLDGTAKGGVVIAIKNELKIPVRFIGVGEGIDDLRPFDAKEFSKALFE